MRTLCEVVCSAYFGTSSFLSKFGIWGGVYVACRQRSLQQSYLAITLARVLRSRVQNLSGVGSKGIMYKSFASVSGLRECKYRGRAN